MEWSNVGALVAAILGLVGVAVSAIASVYNAFESQKNAKDIAEMNSRFGKELAEINAFFSKDLKQAEFRLAYQKELALKRISAYDRISAKISGIYETKQASTGEMDMVLYDEAMFTAYLVEMTIYHQDTWWLKRDSALLFHDWIYAAVDYRLALKEAKGDRNKVESLPDKDDFVMKTEKIQRSLMIDYLYLDDLDGLIRDLKESERIPIMSEEQIFGLSTD